MKISELPPKIKEKALEYQRNAKTRPRDKTTDNLAAAFNWEFTNEGFDYWSRLQHKEKKDYSTIIFFIFAIITLLIFTILIFTL